jgi:GNAT superfamily N-acetyltransferase
MVEIRESTVDEMFEVCRPLLERHWDEIARNKHLMVLNPDVAKYQRMEAAGMLLILAAWEGAELVGYSVSMIETTLHYADLTVCVNDVVFVLPESRHAQTGLRLIKETESMAKQRGAQLMLWHAKEGTALHALMPRIGYEVQDIIYSKEI